jgi:hypothetical protein
MLARSAWTTFALIAVALLLGTPTSAVPDGLAPNVAPLSPGAPAEVYDPPAGTYPYFPHSIFLERLPPNPGVDPNTAAWLAQTGAGLGRFQFARNAGGLGEDYTIPIYMGRAGDPNLIAVHVHCTEPWGRCKTEGSTVHVDPRALPEDGGREHADSHFAVIDEAERKEYDFWGTRWPPQNGQLTIAWGGVCSLDGDGYDGCSATATGTPLSLGIARVKDILAARSSPHGTLPYAMAVAVRCANGRAGPVIGSDGHEPGCPPEGARLYLDMSDDEVDASQASPIAKVLLRTIDRDHYGMIVTDINGGQHIFSFQVESDLTYTTAGLPGPLVTQLLPALIAEGWTGTEAYNDVYHITIPFPGIDFANKLKFVPVGAVRDAR